MSGPTNESIEVQRQEAYRNGLREAQDIAWRRYVDSGKVNTTALELHDALRQAARLADDVLISLRAAAGVDAVPALADHRTTMQVALDALEVAHAGLEWYRDACPDDVNGSDEEADEVIGNAMQALRDAIGVPVDQKTE